MSSLRRALVSYVPPILGSNRTSIVTRQTFHRPIMGYSYRFYSSNGSTQFVDIDLSTEESKRRLFNRLLYRSKQRGYLELDLILGKWVEDHIQSMDESGIKSLVRVLDTENPDLWKWLTGQEQPPAEVKQNPVFVSVREKVATNLEKHAAPAGQSWVWGWDDFKKGRDGPIAGNQ